MISSLRGKITKISGNYIEIEVGNTGYWVFVGWGFLRKHMVDEEIKIQTYLAVSENDMALYGFENWDELNFFKMLISVSGVGPKTAAQILAESNSLELMKAIGNADVEALQKVKGVGKKTAQRIIVDLKPKIGGLGELNLADERPLLEDDLYLGLKQLGFDNKEIEKVTKKVPKELMTTEEKLSWCLQNLG